jgi:mannose-1-phosphate guanylyltransferase
VIGQNAFLFNSKNCQVNVPNDKLVLIDGLEDYIVVESDNMLMILKNENEQELKNYLKHIDEHKA